MGNKVAVVAQPDYESPGLDSSLRRAIELAGFDLSAVRGARVLIKPNMLGAYPPSMGITSEPALVTAVSRIFSEAGGDVFVGDSPNWMHDIRRVWEVTGLREAVRAGGARELLLEPAGSVTRNGVLISRAVAESDFVINLPRFKTHGLTVMSLAVKNLFGCVCGMQKSIHHRDSGDRKGFAELLVRIAEAARPALTIVDGIVAMEGEGPSGGELVKMGVLLAGTDVHSLDAACCRLVGLPPLELDTLSVAQRMGLFDNEARIDFAGDPVDQLTCREFRLPSTYTRGSRDWWISRFVMDRIWNAARVKPFIDPELCKRCLLCVGGCPVSAIGEQKGGAAPVVDEKRCIQCFCCHELCPHKAIELRRGRAVRLVGWLIGRQTKGHIERMKRGEEG